jgi:hypothetical protein
MEGVGPHLNVMAHGVMEMQPETPRLIEALAGSAYSMIRVTLYYCYNCRSLERQAAIAAGSQPDDDAGLHALHVVIGRN